MAVDQGAVELDVVINIGALRSGDLGLRARRAGGPHLRGRSDAGQSHPRDGVPDARAGRGRLPRGRRGSGRVRQERHRLFAARRGGGRDRAHAPRRRRQRRGQGRGRRPDAGRDAGHARRRRVPRRRDGHGRDRRRSGGRAARRRSGPLSRPARPRRSAAAPSAMRRGAAAPSRRIDRAASASVGGLGACYTSGCPGPRRRRVPETTSPRRPRCPRKACCSPRETNHHLRSPRSRGSHGGAVYPGPRPAGRGPFGFPGFLRRTTAGASTRGRTRCPPP